MTEYLQEQQDQLAFYRVIIEEATQKDPERMRKELELVTQAKADERTGNAMWQRVTDLTEKRKRLAAMPRQEDEDSEARANRPSEVSESGQIDDGGKKASSQYRSSDANQIVEGAYGSPGMRTPVDREAKAKAARHDSAMSIKKGQEIGEVTEKALQAINRRAARKTTAPYGTGDRMAVGDAPDTLSEPPAA
jgi:hypothetical protein